MQLQFPFELQLQPSGQPMHFLQLFLALYTYTAAAATIAAIITIAIILSIRTSPQSDWPVPTTH